MTLLAWIVIVTSCVCTGWYARQLWYWLESEDWNI